MYINLTDADAYFEKKFNYQLWAGTVSATKERAIKEASLMLDNFNYTGTKTDDAQEHEFPRNDETTIPEKMQWACAELAYHILEGYNIDKEIEQLSVTSQGFASARVTYARDRIPEHLKHGISSMLAWGYMRPYLAPFDTIKINKV